MQQQQDLQSVVAIVEKDLAISAVARAKATTNAAIATQQAAIADLERAKWIAISI